MYSNILLNHQVLEQQRPSFCVTGPNGGDSDMGMMQEMLGDDETTLTTTLFCRDQCSGFLTQEELDSSFPLPSGG